MDDVRQLLEDAGIILIYLPPYSPDLNPIEEAFARIKSYLKEHEDLMGAFPQPISLVQSAFDNITLDLRLHLLYTTIVKHGHAVYYILYIIHTQYTQY